LTANRYEGDNQEFFDDDQQVWSKRKLRILDKYVDAWTKKRQFGNAKLLYVDGFAGRGRYGKVEPYDYGSPVLIARKAQAIYDQKKTYRLYCYNTEIDPARCATLREVLSFADPEIVKTYCGPFTSHLPTIIGETRGWPAIFFIDPCGLIGIEPSDLAPVVSRPDSEILLTFSLPTAFRLSGSISSSAPEAREKANRLSKVLGENPNNQWPEWANKKDELGIDEWADWVVNRYRTQLQKLNPNLKFGFAYPVRESLRSATKYFLIFATRSMEGFPFMTDFICSEEEEMDLDNEMAQRAQGQLSMFEARVVLNREAQFPALIEEIYAFGKAHPGTTRKDLFEYVAYRYLGKFKQKHIRYMVDQLVEAKRADIPFGPEEKDRRVIIFK
jgi:three-Cys-motif partner protein